MSEQSLNEQVAVRVFQEPKPDYPDPEPMHSSRLGRSKYGAWIHGRCGAGWFVLSFSESIQCAMQVVEKMRERGYGVVIADHFGQGPWVVSFEGDGIKGRSAEATAESLPRAICEAALKAIGDRQ